MLKLKFGELGVFNIADPILEILSCGLEWLYGG
jgi:hypothetical protein